MTFSNLMRKWLEDNRLSIRVGNNRFGKVTFWKWLNDTAVPYEARVPEISDKTGLSIREITDAIKESKKQKKDKNQPALPPHTMEELANEADAVRKLKAGLEGINQNNSDDCAKDTAAKPDSPKAERITVGNIRLNPNISMEVPEPQEKESFDNLLVKFAETYKQIGEIERQIVKLQALQSDLEMKLMTIKKQIRSAA